MAIDRYVEAVAALDRTGLPAPVSAAWDRHLDAWRRMGRHLETRGELRGEMHELFSRLAAENGSERFSALEAEIWSSWQDLETKARRFGSEP